ncbi:MAG: hypothetical protein ACOXZV_04760 [Bacteroidales bacterium]|jgi:hypothetical protein
MNWYITNRFNNSLRKEATFNTNISDGSAQDNIKRIYVEGYVIPRNEYYDQYKGYSQIELIRTLYLKFGKDFINYVKGAFIIIIFLNDGFYIFSDIHSVKKFFIYRNGDEFCISNSLKYITDNYKVTIDYENSAIFALISHFLNGATLFKEVISAKPGQIISFYGDILREDFYWEPESYLRNRKPKKVPVCYFSETWKNIINNYIEYFKPGGISVTLTGGNDSRMVLSALLFLKKDFHAFSFGNPESYDGVVAKKIAQEIQLNYANHFVKEPTLEWLENHADQLIVIGNSLINIHRAHRYDAIRSEKNIIPDSDMVFTGLMGGEYLKEPRYDDIVIPALFEKLSNFKSKKDTLSYIKIQLESKGLITHLLSINEIYNRLMQIIEKGNGLSHKEKKFVYAFYYYGCSHHTQDCNVFGQYFKYVVSPFMDIDFLEMLSEYHKWYVNRKINVVNRIFHSELFVAVTDFLSPELSGIQYAKRGSYSANDLLRNKRKYLIKRILYLINKDREKYPKNFPVGKWLFDFCVKHLQQISPEFSSVFNVNVLQDKLVAIQSKTTEASWHIITNPINLNLIYNYYGKT